MLFHALLCDQLPLYYSYTRPYIKYIGTLADTSVTEVSTYDLLSMLSSVETMLDLAIRIYGTSVQVLKYPCSTEAKLWLN
jgi:hypothetical protein